ncbi:MAG: LemA family protein, partial [Minisyncoccia bacterium]
MTIIYIILAIVVVLALWVVGAYNGFVKLVTRAKEAWSDIDVQLKRRYDLIPNLVEMVKGYAKHE